MPNLYSVSKNKFSKKKKTSFFMCIASKINRSDLKLKKEYLYLSFDLIFDKYYKYSGDLCASILNFGIILF